MAVENKDLKLAFDVLSAKSSAHGILWKYYDGDQPLRYSSERLREVFNKIDVRFIQNWCEVIVNAVTDRLEITGFNVPDDDGTSERLADLWKSSQLNLDAHDVHLAAAVTGEAFIIAWRNDKGEIDAYYNDPRNVCAIYEADQPRQMRFAAKWWTDDVKLRHMTLYYPQRLEYYVSDGKGDTYDSMMLNLAKGDKGTAQNPFGEIPVFHFQRERRCIKGELSLSIVSMQDAVNKQLSDMMVTSEFSAFNQRYVIGNFEMQGKIPNSPGITVMFPGASEANTQSTSVGTFPASDLDVYLGSMDRLANAMAIISRTPKHYFFQSSGAPSGESLLVQESPLAKKCEKYIERMAPVWEDLARFLLKLANVTVADNVVRVQYADVKTVQPQTEAETMLALTRAGMPLPTICRDKGWSPEELDQMKQDRADWSTSGSIPSLAAIPLNAPEEAVVGAKAIARESLAGGAEPKISQAIQAAVDEAVERITKDPKFAAGLKRLEGAQLS